MAGAAPAARKYLNQVGLGTPAAVGWGVGLSCEAAKPNPIPQAGQVLPLKKKCFKFFFIFSRMNFLNNSKTKIK